jgi:hypothetical protein
MHSELCLPLIKLYFFSHMKITILHLLNNGRSQHSFFLIHFHLEILTSIMSSNDIVYYRFYLQCIVMRYVLMYSLIFKISFQIFNELFSHTFLNLSPISFITSSPNQLTNWLLIYFSAVKISCNLNFPKHLISAITSFISLPNFHLTKTFTSSLTA